MGEPEATPVMHAAISGPMFARTGGNHCPSNVREQPATPIAQAMLGATAVECIPISATVSKYGACNNEFNTHYEGSGSGGDAVEAIADLLSIARLPPGHDPGAGCGVVTAARQRWHLAIRHFGLFGGPVAAAND